MAVTTGLSILLGATLAAGPVLPGQASPAASGDGTRPHSPTGLHQPRQHREDKPAVTRLAPLSGQARGGTDVVIRGRGFEGVKRVLFGTTRASHVRVKSARKLVVEAPAHAEGRVAVKVVTKQGASKETKEARFTYTREAPPTVTWLDPASGTTAGGTQVTVTGTGFTRVTGVTFAGAAGLGVTVMSATQLTVTTPAHTAGAVDVQVSTADGSSPPATPARFTYVTPQPALTRVAPGSGPAAGGATVTLTGAQLAGATAVRFGSSGAKSFTVVSPTTITATTPAHAVGAVNVTVSTPGGSATLEEAFSYVPAPTLASVAPESGPMDGATVTLRGSGFIDGTVVTFGGVRGSAVSVEPGGTELTVNTPGHAAGWVDVTVTTVGGSDTIVRGYLFVGGTTLTDVLPSAGPVSGGVSVTLVGTGFTEETLVIFGSKPSLDVTRNPPGTRLTALLPAHAAGTVDVVVATQGDSATLVDGFTYVEAPTVAAVAPGVGPVVGGTRVTVSGSGFRAGMQVYFDDVRAFGVGVNPAGTKLSVTTPPHVAGVVDVSVSTSGGAATLTDGYEYVEEPALTAVSPDAGPVAGGTRVTLTGSGFRAGMKVFFGDARAIGVVVNPAGTQLTAVTSAHAAGLVDVTATTPGGSAVLTDGFVFMGAPTVAAVAPGVGPVVGGTRVTVSGSGFRAGMQVLVGGVPATAVVVDPDGTELTALTPAHEAGVVDVSVNAPGGSATLVDGFTYVAEPTLTAVSPDAGPVAGGTRVTLSGSGFRAGMQVFIGGIRAIGVVVNPPGTRLTALTPAHAAGVVDVSVTTPGGSATLVDGYEYVVEPTLTAVSPDAGPVAGGTRVTLGGSGFRAGMQVFFGDTRAIGVVVNPDGTQLTVVTPAHPAGLVDVTATTPGGTAMLAGAFTYQT